MDVKTASRVLDLFDLFADQRTPMLYSEIAAAMGIPLSSCHGLLKTLVAKGYLYDLGKRSGYYPTQKLLHVAQVICERDPLVTTLWPLLLRLRDQTRETVILAKLADQQVVYLSLSESTQSIRYSHQPGTFKRLHATSSGKALLAVMSSKDRGKLLDKYTHWDSVTANTHASREALEQDIEEGIQRGWQRSHGENIEEVGSLAFGFNVYEQAFALVIAGPLSRIQHNETSLAACFPSAKKELVTLLHPTPLTFVGD